MNIHQRVLNFNRGHLVSVHNSRRNIWPQRGKRRPANSGRGSGLVQGPDLGLGATTICNDLWVDLVRDPRRPPVRDRQIRRVLWRWRPVRNHWHQLQPRIDAPEKQAGTLARGYPAGHGVVFAFPVRTPAGASSLCRHPA